MRYELKKVLSKPFLAFLLICFVVNGYLFYNQQQYVHQEILQDYDEYLALIELLEQDIHLDLESLQRQGSDGEENSIASYFAQAQQKHILMYPDYIRELPERAQAANQLAGAGSYTIRNTEKTTADFSGMENLALQIGPDHALTAVYDFPVTDMILLVFLFMICVRLFSYEHDRGLFGLILSNRSRIRTGVSKILTMLVLMVFFSAALYLTNLGIGASLFGIGDLSRPVQSVAEFRTSSLLINCGQYLLLGFGMKILCAFVIGLLVLMAFALLHKASLVFLAAAAVAGVELALYQAIPVNSSANAMHFINLFHFMDSFNMLSYYQNINLAGYPVNVLTVFPVVMGVLGALSIGIFLWLFAAGVILRQPRIAGLADLLLNGVRRVTDRIHCHSIVFFHECRKILLSRRAGIFLISLLALMLYQNNTFYRVTGSVDQAIQDYVDQIGGRITQDTLDFLEQEALFLQTITGDEKLFYEGRIEAFPIIQTKVQTALEREQERGIDAYLVHETGYDSLMSDQDGDNWMVVLIIIFSILCCAGIFSSENAYQTKKLLRICRGGNVLVYQKALVGLILCLLISGIVFLFQFLMIQKAYPLGYSYAPIQSLEAFAFYSRELSIGEYLVQLYCIRALGSVALCFGILGISSICKGEATSITLSAAVFAAPVAAVTAGIEAANFISLSSLIGGNAYLAEDRKIQYLLFGSLILLGGIASVLYYWRQGMAKRNIRFVQNHLDEIS